MAVFHWLHIKLQHVDNDSNEDDDDDAEDDGQLGATAAFRAQLKHYINYRRIQYAQQQQRDEHDDDRHE